MGAGLRVWLDLTPYWERLHAVGAERDAQKKDYASRRPWTGEPSFVGLLGEQVYGLATDQAVDLTLRKGGDSGPDFPDGVDVKATPRWQAPELWLNAPLAKTGKKAKVKAFALVALDIEAKRGALIGVVPRAWCAKSPIQDTKNGPKHILTTAQVVELDRRMRTAILAGRDAWNETVTRATEDEAAQQRRRWAELEAAEGQHPFYACAGCGGPVEYSHAALSRQANAGRILCGVCAVAARRAEGGGVIEGHPVFVRKPRPVTTTKPRRGGGSDTGAYDEVD